MEIELEDIDNKCEYQYSPSAGVFFPRDIAYDDLPDDLVDVEDGQFDLAMNRPLGSAFDVVEGKVVIIGKGIDQKAIDAQQARFAIDSARGTREKILVKMSGIAMFAGVTDEMRMVRQSLLDLPADKAVKAAKNRADCAMAIDAAFKRIFDETSPDLRSIFNVDALPYSDWSAE